MATQRITVAALGGEAAKAIGDLFHAWASSITPQERIEVDAFCEALRGHAATPPILYFCEWIDRWLMGDQVPGPGSAAGCRYQAACLSPVQAVRYADWCGEQFREQRWFAARLREAAAGWESLSADHIVVVTREVLGPSATDDEVRDSLRHIPDWLARQRTNNRPQG